MKYKCRSCSFLFTREQANSCPRCDGSKLIARQDEDDDFTVAKAPAPALKTVASTLKPTIKATPKNVEQK